MAVEDAEARALARARAERVRLTKIVGEARYLATSRGVEPGACYEVTVTDYGQVRCSCAGFSYRGLCKHAAALRARLEREQRRATRKGS